MLHVSLSFSAHHSFFSFFSISLLFTLFFFFFNDTATTEIYTLSLHDALPILDPLGEMFRYHEWATTTLIDHCAAHSRSEEHTSELQSRVDLVCRLLLEKKKKKKKKEKQIKQQTK